MALLKKCEIFAASPATRDVSIPEWGGDVRVRAYSLRDRVALLDAVTENAQAVLEYQRDQELPEDEGKGLPEVKPLESPILEIIFSCVDEDGNRAFDLADHDRIRELSFASLTAIMAAIREINEPPVSTHDALKKSSE